jgi:hypothetical protein
MRFENKIIFFHHGKRYILLQYGVVVVNSEVVELATGA